MKIRSIEKTDLTLFANTTDNPARADGFAKMVAGMWQSGESRPEWCFLIEEAGETIGRIGYFKHESRNDTVGIFGLTLPWDGDFLASGRTLMTESSAHLPRFDITTIQRELNAAWGTFDEQAQLLLASGFEMQQEQLVYELEAPASLGAAPSRLQFKPLSAVGDDQFMQTMAAATVGTADRTIQKIIADSSLEAFAQGEFNFLRDNHEVEDEWWNVAYDQAGETVGFVQSVRFPNSTEGNLAFMGVLPTQRGNGYGKDLLFKGTQCLLDSDVTVIVARTDGTNYPIQKTFSKLGYQKVGRLQNHIKAL